MKKLWTKKENFVWLLVLIVAMGLFLIKGSPVFAVNDDLFMKNIISGAYLGRPDAHAIYMEYPLTLFLSLLYGITDVIPWYGIFMVGVHLFVISVVMQRIVHRAAGKGMKWILFATSGIVCGVALYTHVFVIQFTVTAAVAGGGALFWLMTSDLEWKTEQGKKDICVILFFLLLAFFIRRNVLFMLIPIGGMLWLTKCIQHKNRIKDHLILAGAAVVSIGGCLLLYMVAYSDQGWKDYKEYNDAATVLYDYSGWPDYEENKELYDSYGVSKEAYEGASKRYMLCMDHNINKDSLIAFADVSKKAYDKGNTPHIRVERIGHELRERTDNWADRPLNFLVISVYIIVLLFAIIERKWSALLAVMALFIGRMVSWAYVIYAGRFPTRISQSLFMAELFALIGIFAGYELWRIGACHTGRSTICKKITLVVVTTGCFLVILYVGKQSYSWTDAQRDWRSSTAGYVKGIVSYCGDHEENFYFVDDSSVSYFTEEVFDGRASRYQNFIVFGGWLSGSPVYNNKVDEHTENSAEADLLNSDRAFVIFQQSEEISEDYLWNYFSGKYEGFNYKKVDAFQVKDKEFSVYQLSRK